MRKFHSLTVSRIAPEARDAMRISFDLPDALKDAFEFEAGQHLAIEAEVDGQRLRRTYSLCSLPGVSPLEIGVRLQQGGKFSTYVKEHLKVGDKLSVMPPIGQFRSSVREGRKRNCVAFAAGSGITPIVSIVAETLQREPDSRFLLIFGNRQQDSAMCVEDLFALKNRFLERLQLHFLFSREAQELPVMSGRLDEAKVRELYDAFCREIDVDDVFVCGPDSMIGVVTDTLVSLGVAAERIHAERFGAPRRSSGHAPGPATDAELEVSVTVIMDGQKRLFSMARDASSIVEAAADAGIELPYSCKGGVCATCRTHLREGSVQMAVNYGLEPWEVDKGFILACQSRPESDNLTIDYDRS